MREAIAGRLVITDLTAHVRVEAPRGLEVTLALEDVPPLGELVVATHLATLGPIPVYVLVEESHGQLAVAVILVDDAIPLVLVVDYHHVVRQALDSAYLSLHVGDRATGLLEDMVVRDLVLVDEGIVHSW